MGAAEMRGRSFTGTMVALGCALLCAPFAASAEENMRCRLLDAGAETLKTADCMACHDGRAGAAWTGDARNAPPTLHQTHPVDVDYSRATTMKKRARLRDQAETVRRGAFLPDGYIRCATCHDARSQYRFRLSIPTTGASAPSPDERTGSVDPTPLCALCHTIADVE
jgi:hypothetical protein